MNSRQARKILGVPSYWTLANLIRGGRIKAPKKDPDTGEYDWSEQDIEAARVALKARRRKG